LVLLRSKIFLKKKIREISKSYPANGRRSA
jgi:hypothetical protein